MIRSLTLLLRWDVILLHRNRLFAIAALVTALYIGIFYLFRGVDNLVTVLVVLVFNDPVVTGYLFGGVLWLFDRNQHTLQAIAVLPVPFTHYLLSKVLILSLLAVILSVAMTLATQGLSFNGVHLVVAVFLQAFIFSCFGFTVGSLSPAFNQFLAYSIPFLILTGAPLLALFNIGKPWYFVGIPSWGGLELLRTALAPGNAWATVGYYLHLGVWSLLSWWIMCTVTARQLQ
jgi:hypothetical protein